MTVALNHTIVHVRDKVASAQFLVDILGLAAPTRFASFVVVALDNEVSMDFLDVDPDVDVYSQHYAFLVTETEFDQILGRIRDRQLPFWADPGKNRRGEHNTHNGGRGIYWDDLDGHLLEIITRPYVD